MSDEGPPVMKQRKLTYFFKERPALTENPVTAAPTVTVSTVHLTENLSEESETSEVLQTDVKDPPKVLTKKIHGKAVSQEEVMAVLE